MGQADVSVLQGASTGGDERAPWCAVYTRHQHEKTVAEMLAAKGLEVFLPLYDSLRVWKDRKKLLSLPLFPGYVFVRGAIAHRLQVLTTPGVHMMICNGDHIAVIPEQEIEAIRRAVTATFRVEPHPFLKCGEWVRIKRGKLEGIEGILVRKKGLYRLVLSVEMLAQSVALEIAATDIESTTRSGNASPTYSEPVANSRPTAQPCTATRMTKTAHGLGPHRWVAQSYGWRVRGLARST